MPTPEPSQAEGQAGVPGEPASYGASALGEPPTPMRPALLEPKSQGQQPRHCPRRNPGPGQPGRSPAPWKAVYRSEHTNAVLGPQSICKQ